MGATQRSITGALRKGLANRAVQVATGVTIAVGFGIGVALLANSSGASETTSTTAVPTDSAPGPDLDGVVYVLLAADVGVPTSVVALDSTSGEVLATFDASFDPEAAVDTERDRLYIASGLDPSYLSVLNGSDGRLLHQVAFPHRWNNTLPTYDRRMVLSPKGRWLYALKAESLAPERDLYTVAVFDAERGEFGREELPLGDCAGGRILADDSTVRVMCPHTGALLSFPVLGEGSFGPPSSVNVTGQFVPGAVLVPGTTDVLVMTEIGRVILVGADGVKAIGDVTDDDSVEPAIGGLLVSSDGSRLFVGLGAGRVGEISTVVAYDLDSNQVVAELRLPTPAWTLSLSEDGGRIFAPSYEARQVHVIDTEALTLVTSWSMPDRPVQVLGP